MWDEGLTTAEIGRHGCVSKNAVVGIAHRLELPSRPSPIRRGITRKTARPSSKPSTQQRSAQRNLPISSTGSRCKWPKGHPGESDFHYCGDPALESKPYCGKHYEMAYIQPRPKVEENAAY